MIELAVLGPVEIRRVEDGALVPVRSELQLRVLLALFLADGRVMTVDQLADRVWLEDPPQSAVGSLRTYVNRLRTALGPEGTVLETVTGGYRLRSDLVRSDVDRLSQLLLEDRATLHPDDRLRLLEEAAGLWRGDAFGQFASHSWVQAEATRLDELRVETAQRQLEVLIDLERYDDAAIDAGRLVEDHPYRESVRHAQVLALYRSGRQSDALAALETHRRVMAEDLGLDLSPELRDLQQKVLEQDASLEQANPQGQRLRSYRVGAVLGAGPRATVYRGSQPDIGREVVLKVFVARLANDPVFVEQFERHARRIAQLDHPSIVPVLDYWREPGRAVVVTRRTHGEPLAVVAARRDMTLDEALTVASDALDGIRYAHRNGVAHGAVSATNILVDGSGRAYLTDFALHQAGGDEMPADLEDVVQAIDSVLDAAVAEAFGAQVRSMLEEPSPHQLTNPYVGLGSFGENDAAVFFGRERLVSDLVARLDRESTPLLALVGPSGAGKSSVVHAGLIPALRQSTAPGALVTSFVPGPQPLRALSEAFISLAVQPIDVSALGDGPVADAAAALLRGLNPAVREATVVVDQFEEAFVLEGSEGRLDRFLDLLVAVTESRSVRVRVVVTMRSEYLDRALGRRALAPLLQTSTVAVGPMQPEELEEAIRAPARMCNVVVEPSLVSRLVADMAGRPGALPLLQFTMTHLFSEREGPTLGLDAYEALGGLSGALQRHAEAVVAELAYDEGALRRVLLQLVHVEEDRPPTKRRVPRRELLSIGGVDDDLLRALASARLVMSDRDPASREPTLELSHEAILWSWPRLAKWIDANRQLLAHHSRLVDAARIWISEARDPGLLLSGVRLDAARELAGSDGPVLNDQQQEYIRESERADLARREAAQRDLERERSRSRRLRLAVGAVGLALVVAIGLGIVAQRESSRANSEAEAATTAAIANRALVESTDRAEVALLLALEAMARDDGVASQQALLAALEQSPPPAVDYDLGRHESAPPTFCRATRTSDGSFLSLGGDNVFEPTEAALVNPKEWSVRRIRSPLWCIAWANEAGTLLAGRGANTDIVVDGSDGSLVRELQRDLEVVGIAGEVLIGLAPRLAERGFVGELNARYEIGIVRSEGTEPARVIAVDALSGQTVRQSSLVAERAVVSPDGERVFTWDGRVGAGRQRGLLDAATLEPVVELATGEVAATGWSQDGSVVVIVGPSGATELRGRDGELIMSGTVSLPSGTRQLAYDPSHGALAILGRSEVRIFRVGRPFVQFSSFPVDDAPQAVGWLDTQRLAIVGRSGLVRVYDVFADYGLGRTLSCCESGATPQLLHGSYGSDGAQLIDLSTGAIIDPTAFGALADPDSLLVASLADGRILTLVDAPFPPELGLYDPATANLVRGRPFEYEQFVDADAVVALPAGQPGRLVVGLVKEFAGGVTTVDLVEVDAATLEPMEDPRQIPLPASYFWNREPTIWQAGLARFEQWDATAALRSQPIDYTEQFLRGGLSPSGEWLLLIDRQSRAFVFDTATGDRVGILPVAVDLTDPVVFDDGRAVVRELDGSLALWDLATIRRIGSVGIAAGPSGSRLLPSIDSTGVWYVGVEGFVFASLDVDDWRRAACQLVTRDLSGQEWDELIGEGEPRSRCPDS